MAVSRERFEQGMSYAAYRGQMTRNQDRFDETERTVRLRKDDIRFFKELAQPLHVLVLAEDWCGDVIANLPVLGRMAQESGKLNLRIFLRDQNLDLMDRYLKDEQYRSIPVFGFFDSEFRELGHWIERPAKMTALMQEARRKHFAGDPELAGFSPATPPSELPEAARLRLSQAMSALRAELRTFSDDEVVREVRALLEGRRLPRAAAGRGPVAESGSQPVQEASSLPRGEQAVKVSITYCAHCGYESQTLDLARALMLAFQEKLATLEIIPWQDGTFDVVVGGELVHSMARDGGFPANERIIDAVRQRVGVPQTQ